jgi:hypothetical protein
VFYSPGSSPLHLTVPCNRAACFCPVSFFPTPLSPAPTRIRYHCRAYYGKQIGCQTRLRARTRTRGSRVTKECTYNVDSTHVVEYAQACSGKCHLHLHRSIAAADNPMKSCLSRGIESLPAHAFPLLTLTLVGCHALFHLPKAYACGPSSCNVYGFCNSGGAISLYFSETRTQSISNIA